MSVVSATVGTHHRLLSLLGGIGDGVSLLAIAAVGEFANEFHLMFTSI